MGADQAGRFPGDLLADATFRQRHGEAAFQDFRLDALLFGESQSRAVLSVKPGDAVKVIERAKLCGVPAARIGVVGGNDLLIKTTAGERRWVLRDIHDLWWNAIARAMA